MIGVKHQKKSLEVYFLESFIEIFKLREVRYIEDNNALADATIKLIDTDYRNEFRFVTVSRDSNKDLVRRAVDNISIARSELPAPVASPILRPEVVGEIYGRTFALWGIKRQFATSHKILNFVNRHLYSQHISDWLSIFTRETLRLAIPDVVINDLVQLVSDQSIDFKIRTKASAIIDMARSGYWQPYNCIQHGDFWKGNILLGNEEREFPFFVIDWAGMNRMGYPFFDLVKFLHSVNSSRSNSLRLISRYCQAVGIAENEIVYYTLSALGNLRRNLENFPVASFQNLTRSLHRFLMALEK